MIIWGWRSIQRTLSTGTFFCPAEGGDRNYEYRNVRRWFTLFFIPLIPLQVLGDFVICTTCGNAYDSTILAAPTALQMQHRLGMAVRHVLTAMARAGGDATGKQESLAVEIVRALADEDYSAADFKTDMAELLPEELELRLNSGAEILSENGKERLLQSALLVAAADGSIEERELSTAVEIGTALTMAPNHVKGVIYSFAESLAGSEAGSVEGGTV